MVAGMGLSFVVIEISDAVGEGVENKGSVPVG
jgi:hypothetical protein